MFHDLFQCDTNLSSSEREMETGTQLGRKLTLSDTLSNSLAYEGIEIRHWCLDTGIYDRAALRMNQELHVALQHTLFSSNIQLTSNYKSILFYSLYRLLNSIADPQ